MTQINAYITFNAVCREAMTFYQECLGGELYIQNIEGTPMEQECPPSMKHLVMHATLTTKGFVLMGSDITGPGGYKKGTDISLSVNCSSEKDLNSFFYKLAAGGQIIDPLKEQFWGAVFGALDDKFGIRWMFNFAKPDADTEIPVV